MIHLLPLERPTSKTPAYVQLTSWDTALGSLVLLYLGWSNVRELWYDDYCEKSNPRKKGYRQGIPFLLSCGEAAFVPVLTVYTRDLRPRNPQRHCAASLMRRCILSRPCTEYRNVVKCLLVDLLISKSDGSFASCYVVVLLLLYCIGPAPGVVQPSFRHICLVSERPSSRGDVHRRKRKDRPVCAHGSGRPGLRLDQRLGILQIPRGIANETGHFRYIGDGFCFVQRTGRWA